MWIIERTLIGGSKVYSIITKDGNEGREEAYKAACFEYAKQVSACDTWDNFKLAKKYIKEKNWCSAYQAFINSDLIRAKIGVINIIESKSVISEALEPEMAIY